MLHRLWEMDEYASNHCLHFHDGDDDDDLSCYQDPPNPPPNLTNPPLAISSANFHSRLKTELLKLSYPDSAPAPRHVRHHHRLQT